MKAEWDRKTGKITFEDGRFIVLTGDDIKDFDVAWCMLPSAKAREEMLKNLIRSKRAIHYPPKR